MKKMFEHCRYNEIFDDTSDDISIESSCITISDIGQNYGKVPDHNKRNITISDVLGFEPATVSESFNHALSSTLAFIAFNPYLYSRLDTQYDSQLLSFMYSFQTSRRIQLSKAFINLSKLFFGGADIQMPSKMLTSTAIENFMAKKGEIIQIYSYDRKNTKQS